MAKAYEQSVLEPEPAQWQVLKHSLRNEWLQALRVSARRRLVRAAGDFRQRLRKLGRSAGVFESSDVGLTGDPDVQPLIMTGHQPVIFHSGLTFKYETTEQSASEQKAIGIAVVIDTDEGDAGAFSWPAPAASAPGSSAGSGSPAVSAMSRNAGREAGLMLRMASGTFAVNSALYASARRKPSKEIAELAGIVERDLCAVGCTAAADQFTRRAGILAKLSTDSMLEANLIVRWSSGCGAQLLEVCLSEICRFPEVIQFFGAILSRPFEFAECYNRTLRLFRAEQKIRNDANPFPDLELADGRCELPFWVVDSVAGTRRIVSIHERSEERTLETTDGFRLELSPGNETAAIFTLLMGGCQLVPRGALITAMLRLMFSDLFVHGTGGGRYDRYTSLLIQQWWQEEPAPFAVASASRFLFDEQRSRLAELQQISSQLRDLQFNPQRYFGSGLFSNRTEQHLQTLLMKKDEAVRQLQQAREAGQSAREIGRVIQNAGDEMKATVSAEFAPRLEELRAIPSESQSVISNRTWPWFFFSVAMSFFIRGVF